MKLFDRYKKRRRSMRIVSLTLITAILASLVIVPAWAYGGGTKKQEVVYVNLNGDGSVDGIYVVNIFDLNGDDRIIDYGDYTVLRNMTTNDEIQFDHQTVQINTKAKKLYYEGKLNSNVIPWSFDIRYSMDGVEHSADEIAGMSGALRITMTVRRNTACNSTFFDNYALQASFTLDTKSCDNIVADGATAANVGSDRQLTYTVLPGKEKDIAITANVTDFEMDGVAINGVPLSLDVNVDTENNQELNDKIKELQDGAVDLDDGANELRDGSGDLENGAADLADGVKEFKDRAAELNDGANELKDGADVLYDGVRSLNDGAGDLSDGAGDLADGSQTLYDGASFMDDGIQALYDGAKELDDGIFKLAGGARGLRNGARSMAEGASGLYGGLKTLTAKNGDLQAMSTLLYNTTLGQYSALLDAGGYTVTAGSTLEKLGAMMKRRQAELTDEGHQAAATQAAVTARMATLSEIAANADGSRTAEEIAAAQAGLNYWNMTLVLQGMEQYQRSLAEALAAAGDDPAARAAAQAACDAAYAHVLSAYQLLLAPYLGSAGGDPDLARTLLLSDHDALSAQVGGSEQAAVREVVTGILRDAVADDDIYKALAVLAYYKGVIGYTDGAASAVSGAYALLGGADDLYDGADELYDGVNGLLGGGNELLDGIKQLMDGAAELKDGTLELHDGALTLRDGVITLRDGTQDLLDGVAELKDGTLTLCDGTILLQDGIVELLDGAIELHDGTVKLHDGTIELTDGTFELRDKTAHIDTELKDKIKDAIHEALGVDFDPVSFVSGKNTNIDFVQFVIQTPAISAEEAENVEEAPAATLNFWQKLLSLFGLYHAE